MEDPKIGVKSSQASTGGEKALVFFWFESVLDLGFPLFCVCWISAAEKVLLHEITKRKIWNNMQTFSAHTIPQCSALNFTYSRCICVVSSCGFPHYPVTLRTNSPRQASFVHYLNINRRPSKNPTFMFPQVPRIPSRRFDTTLVRQKQCVENYKHQRVNQVWSIFQNSARSLGPTCSSETEGELPWPGEHTHSYRHRFNGSQLWMVAWYSKTTINVKRRQDMLTH